MTSNTGVKSDKTCAVEIGEKAGRVGQPVGERAERRNQLTPTRRLDRRQKVPCGAYAAQMRLVDAP